MKATFPRSFGKSVLQPQASPPLLLLLVHQPFLLCRISEGAPKAERGQRTLMRGQSTLLVGPGAWGYEEENSPLCCRVARVSSVSSQVMLAIVSRANLLHGAPLGIPWENSPGLRGIIHGSQTPVHHVSRLSWIEFLLFRSALASKQWYELEGTASSCRSICNI